MDGASKEEAKLSLDSQILQLHEQIQARSVTHI